ncbi:MAG: hypothetical protein ACLR13_07395 [Acutalibacteraceae bacterium]
MLVSEIVKVGRSEKMVQLAKEKGALGIQFTVSAAPVCPQCIVMIM